MQVYDLTAKDRNHGARIIDMTNYFDFMCGLNAPVTPANDVPHLTQKDILVADVLRDFFDETLKNATQFNAGRRSAVQDGAALYVTAIERIKDIYDV